MRWLDDTITTLDNRGLGPVQLPEFALTRCQTIRRPDRTETTGDRRGVRAAGRARCWTTTACLVVLVALASVLCGCVERMLLVSSETLAKKLTEWREARIKPKIHVGSQPSFAKGF